jgi:Tol biopolymer transport system component
VINTGFATHNSNDHVLSFDGRMLAISNNAPEDSAPIVYTVRAVAHRSALPRKGPSYLRGWSPDGRWLVFVGQHQNDFDVYRISSTVW